MKVSVILITYNGHEYFEEQFTSITHQKNLDQILIYDDKSEESFQSFLKSKNDVPKTNVHLREKNLGARLNIKDSLLNNIDKKLIALADQDDVWLPSKLSNISQSYNPNYSELPQLIYHDLDFINENGEIIGRSIWKSFGQFHYEHNLETFLFGNFVTGSASAFNTSLAHYIETIPSDLEYYHDAWLALAAFTFGQTVRINEVLGHYRLHGNNLALYDTKGLNFLEKRALDIKLLLNPENYLRSQFQLAEYFYETYSQEIPSEKKKIMTSFLALRSKNYIHQKFARRRVIKKYSF